MGDAEFLHHEPCESCGSSDAKAVYSDGGTYCFSCERAGKMEGHDSTPDAGGRSPRSPDLIEGTAQALTKRGITLATAEKWGYQVGTYQGSPVQIANYCDNRGRPIAQKIRTKDKQFRFLGDAKKAGLYGQWLWRDSGKMIVVTEGELDALTVSQCFDNRWPVVSVNAGAQSAKKLLRNHLDWLLKFDTVILCFDSDEPGKKAAEDCAQLFPPSRVKIANLPLKDANEMLVAKRQKELVDAIWGAKEYRPDGIIAGIDLWETLITEDTKESAPYPFTGLQEKTHGIRKGEIVTITAGSGIGKSQFSREISYSLLQKGGKLGILALEESVKRTAQGLLSMELNRPLHLLNFNEVPEDEMRRAFDATLGTGNVYLYDHFGSTDIENLMLKLQYMVNGLGCEWVVLDHLSIVVSGLGDGDERRLIDNTMTRLRTFVEQTQCGLILISHLKRPSGERGHEEGAQTSLAQLRGSAAIAQLSDMVIGLERNQQGDRSNVTTVRVLKNRFSGETGITDNLEFNPETGRMFEVLSEDLEESFVAENFA